MGVESVLLYYKYIDLKDQQEEIRSWYLDLCEKLSLVGRIRVAEDGVNVTVGGAHAALLEHIGAVEQHPSLGADIDFKLAKSSGPLNDDATRESGFDSLQVSLCKEVVSLGGIPQCSPKELPQQTAPHLSPSEWHDVLQSLGPSESTVLLDTRNVYETRIGHFSADGAELVDPQLRQFGDLPAWLQANAARLRDRRVLMYCTGGVRCERASALLKSMGPGFSNVFQLQGGIQRYLEQFPDGGCFRGKNFVFDERVAVAPEAGREAPPVGRCLACSVACDDYGPRRRCRRCRLLVLLCSACAQGADSQVCELCRANSVKPRLDSKPQRRLRILCLHGFRQTGRSLGRQLARFERAVADLAELSFVDGPHVLPFLYRPAANGEVAKPLPIIDPTRPRRAWFVEPSQCGVAPDQEPAWEAIDESATGHQYRQQTAGWQASLNLLQSFVADQGPFDGCLGFSQGAAMATALCAECQGQATISHQQDPDEPPAAMPFRFVILCSGYASFSPQHGATQRQIGCIRLPSLHVFGADGQVAAGDSRALTQCFQEEGRTVLEHKGSGHCIPLDKRCLNLVRRFLEDMQ